MLKLLIHPEIASIVRVLGSSLQLDETCTIRDLSHRLKVPYETLIGGTEQIADLLNRQHSERSQLIIYGSYLEFEVTELALSAISIGLHVFIVVDCVLSQFEDKRAVCLDRLYPYGAIPILEAQLEHELSRGEKVTPV